MREDWVEVELGDVCDIVSGKNQKQVQNLNGNFPIYGSGGIFGYADEYLCEPGTTIIGRKGTINSPIFVNEKFWNVDTAFGISPKNYLIAKYNYYFCLGFNFKKLDKSTTIPSLAKRDILRIKYFLAPLPIQRAIVSKIENLFTSLDKGMADLKKAQGQLKVYRQAVLKKAFEGDWKVVKLNNVVNELSQGWSPKSKNTNSSNEEEWAVIKTSAIQHGAFIENENKILPDSIEPREQHEIKIGDILITRAGPRSRVGVCCLVKQTRPKLINCDKVYRLRLSDKILNDFFMYKMNSVEFLNKIEEIKTGGNDSGVNLTQNRFLNLEFELPPVDNQKQIIKEIESRLSVCDKIEQNISEALTKSDALRQSILKKAFEGKLLNEAEIEKCKQEADYEPASVLLERIKKEKK